MAFIEVLKLKDLKNGQSKLVNIKGNEIALYNVNGKIYATSNVCLHHKGSLAGGALNDNIVSCPLHGWQYDVINGSCKTVPGLKLKTFNVKIENEKILLDL
ncbi:MAG: Rieske 2Fe-2S domain-containing protein [Nanoarchaeota archaeon]